MASPLDLSRLSLNLITVDGWSLDEALDGCARAGIQTVGVWRAQLENGAAPRVAASSIGVSGLCRGGFFPAASARERAARIDDNRRAIEEAAELGTDVLVMVCGPSPDRDLAAARRMVAEGIDAVLPHALDHGVTLGVEPLHPMMIGERSVIVTLREAVDLARAFGHGVGVVVDAYHVFWDPSVEAELDRATGLIVGFHVSDWLVPTTSTIAGRGLMGDGIIDLRRLRLAVERAGYTGPIEVEIINPELSSLDRDELVRLVCERFTTFV
jgi:sugar phosphate isomerase/epimerase